MPRQGPQPLGRAFSPRDGIVMSPRGVRRRDSAEPALAPGAVVRDRQIIIGLDEPAKDLKLGMTARIEFDPT